MMQFLNERKTKFRHLTGEQMKILADSLEKRTIQFWDVISGGWQTPNNEEYFFANSIYRTTPVKTPVFFNTEKKQFYQLTADQVYIITQAMYNNQRVEFWLGEDKWAVSDNVAVTWYSVYRVCG